MDPWSRGREVARDALRPLPKLEKMSDFCHRSGIEIFGRLFSVHQRPNVFFSDAWQVPATYHRPSCELCDAIIGWAGAPDERALCRFHDAVAVLADRCQTRPRIPTNAWMGFHENCAAFARASQFRVTCPAVPESIKFAGSAYVSTKESVLTDDTRATCY